MYWEEINLEVEEICITQLIDHKLIKIYQESTVVPRIKEADFVVEPMWEIGTARYQIIKRIKLDNIFKFQPHGQGNGRKWTNLEVQQLYSWHTW